MDTTRGRHCSDAMRDVYNFFAIRVLHRGRYLSRTPFILSVSLIQQKVVARRWNLFSGGASPGDLGA